MSSKLTEADILVRKLSRLSENKIAFLDKHKERLANTLLEFTEDELLTAFKEWLVNKDLDDPRNLQYLPGEFVQVADQLANGVRQHREDSERQKVLRDAAVKRMQAQAEAERQEVERRRTVVERPDDPMYGLLE